MVAGKADPQKLYFGGKLKISGDVMASQKLMFLKKIDPKQARRGRDEDARRRRRPRRRGGGAAAAPSGEPTSAEAFAVIRDYIEKNPGMAARSARPSSSGSASPDSAWMVDLKNGKGAVTAGG